MFLPAPNAMLAERNCFIEILPRRPYRVVLRLSIPGLPCLQNNNFYNFQNSQIMHFIKTVVYWHKHIIGVDGFNVYSFYLCTEIIDFQKNDHQSISLGVCVLLLFL